MVNNNSPFLAITSLGTELNARLRVLDLPSLSRPEQKLVNGLRNDVADVRLDIRDYELSETRDEQVKKAKDAKIRVEQIRQAILQASEYNLFTAIDVAQVTAQLEQINGWLR